MRKTDLHMRPLDVFLVAVIAAAGILLIRHIALQLNYHWAWQRIPQYLLRYDAATRQWVPNLLLQGLFTTLRLSLWAGLLATVIGLTVGLISTGRRLFWRLLSATYVELVRNTPPLVLIFIGYYFISDQLLPIFGISEVTWRLPPSLNALVSVLIAPPRLLPAFIPALITLAVFEGAYMAEIVRAGVQSIERGQWEAADSLGLNRWKRMYLVIMPQAVRRILPPMAGQFISIVKDSAIVSVISIQELTFQAMELMASTYLTIEIWITVAALYFVLTFSCSLGVSRLEAVLARKSG